MGTHRRACLAGRIALLVCGVVPGLASAGQDANVPRTVSFTEVVCGPIPAVPVTFEMPADFLSRAAGSSADAGCIWGGQANVC